MRLPGIFRDAGWWDLGNSSQIRYSNPAIYSHCCNGKADWLCKENLQLRQVHIHNLSRAYILRVRIISMDGQTHPSIFAHPLQCRHTLNAREEN